LEKAPSFEKAQDLKKKLEVFRKAQDFWKSAQKMCIFVA
jgi:hypothetical protein